MKKLLLFLALLPAAFAQNINVQKTADGTNSITADLAVNTSRTLTIGSGGTLVLGTGSTFTLGSATIPWSAVNKTGSNLTDLPTRLFSSLQSIPSPVLTVTGDITGTATFTGLGSASLASTYNNVVPTTKGGAGAINGLLKANGSGVVSQAIAGTDYAAGISVAAYSVLANSTASAAPPASTQSLIVGTPAITDTGVASQFTASTNSYYQHIIQNTSTGTLASSDFVVNNNLSTATTFYGDFGINGGGFTGTGAFNAPSTTFLTATSGDLALGTTTANAIHFVVNSGTTDAATISSAGVFSLATALGPVSGGTGQNTYLLGDTLYSSASNTLAKLAGNTSATMGVLTQTGNGTISAAPAWTLTTGTGNVVRATTPTLVTPVLGAATMTSLNKVAITAPTTAATLAFPTDNATVTFQGTDTYVGRATTDTLTNKTFDTAGAGNVLKIAGTTISSVSGTGSVNVLQTSPTLITPALGVATATSVNGLTPTALATGFSVAGGTASKTLTVSNTMTLAGTDASTLNIATGGTLGSAAFTAASAYQTPLTFSTGLTNTAGTITVNNSQSIATLSNLTGNGTIQTSGGTGTLSVIANTGTGNNVLNTSPTITSPTLITPTLGVATATSINGNTFTPGSYTLTGTAGKTLNFLHTLTFDGTDATTMTFPTTSATLARTDAGNTFTGHQTIEGVTSTGSTGTGALVFGTSPTLTTPVIGAATGTSLSVSGQLASTVATGTAPLVISSTTNVPNLNASSLNGATMAAPGAIGGTTPSAITGTLITALNNASNPATVTGTGVHLSAADATNNVLLGDASQATGLNLIGRASAGTLAAPGATTAGSTLVALSGRGWANGGFTTADAAALSFKAVNLWSATDNSTQMVVNLTPPGSATPATALTLTSTGLNATAIGSTTPNTGAFTTLSATGLVSLNQATLTNPTPVSGTILHLTGADNAATVFNIDSLGTGIPTLMLRRASGTSASPSAIQNGNGIGAWSSIGYGATAYGSAASGRASFNASENFTDTAQGTVFNVEVTPNGSLGSSRVVALTLTSTGLNSTAIGATTPSTGAFTTLSATGSILSSGGLGTTGIGYSAGAGSAQTQGTSRSTGVTLNRPTGDITLFTSAGSATATTFTVTDSVVGITDTIEYAVRSASNKYLCFTTNVTAGTFDITFYTTGGTASDTPIIHFNVIKGVNN